MHRTLRSAGLPQRGRRLLAFCCFLALAASALPAVAHVAPFTDEQIIRGSQHVVVATVVGKQARWNAQHTLIVTDYTLAVEESLKGEPAGRLTVTVPGGTLNGATDDTCLSVDLAPGARYLLCLSPQALPTLT
ncbi:MAG TPA: hypothetical protein VGE98_09135, partial [Thermoanaerobaculia bacterium]